MEIIELFSFDINNETKIIEVEFRFNEDSEDEFRSDIIELEEINHFGYDLFNDSQPSLDDEFFEYNDENLDQNELKSFLNEYYIIYPDRIPKKSFY